MQAFKKPLSPEQEAHFLALCKAGDMDARQTLIESNMRLVAHIAKKYTCNFETDDLISAGTIGLIKAIDTYDAAKGSRLVTYAARCIENELLMLLRHTKKQAKEVSLSAPIGTDKEGNEISLMDVIHPDADSVLDHMVHDYHVDQLSKLMPAVLTDREAAIIACRYGLFGHPPQTQKQVAQMLDISRSYVSRIEKRVLLKLRKALEV